MTHPKDNGSRRVVLDLSYPRGHSVNSDVDKSKFDESAFVLRFPNIDHITEDIVNCTKNALYLRLMLHMVDPSDSLKRGIH